MELRGPSSAGFMYSDTGGSGPPVVFLHGVLMNGTLWNDVVGGLGDRYRCIVPELPFGAHRTSMPDGADLSLESLVTMTSCRPVSMARRARAHEPSSKGAPLRPAEASARTASDAPAKARRSSVSDPS